MGGVKPADGAKQKKSAPPARGCSVSGLSECAALAHLILGGIRGMLLHRETNQASRKNNKKREGVE
jgi:hypothetical protein